MIENINNSQNSRLGDIAEYYAVTWLWDQGYEVFTNAGCTGAIDMIAVDEDGKCFYIDVKTMYQKIVNGVKLPYRSTMAGALTPYQKEIGVQALGFDPDTRKCKFIEHRHETTYSRYRDQQSAQHDLVLCDSES